MTYDGAVIDLDGTVYRGGDLLAGADIGIEALRRRTAVAFVSNKAIERRADYARKLTDLGVPTEPGEVLNSGAMTADLLAREYPDRAALVVGEAPLVADLEAAGVRVTETPADAGVVVASMDRSFDYETLTAAMNALDGDAAFVATNPDRTCPVADGEIPDAAGMIGAIEGVTGRELDAVAGKPSPTAMTAATNLLEADPGDCLLVGDRLETDIEMGERAGMTTVLVLTGVTDEADLREATVEPDYVLDSLASIETVL
ncbi:HAD-IIA family hydrolase [Halorussus marinus]|uniref:HAD-IIA family hydrolase n=1 Tax=Halorussus marinus TaxID=2505976 RepID=UPI001092AFFC|nr:HAD-IIA family hydrolase [Halorussus marinus]